MKSSKSMFDLTKLPEEVKKLFDNVQQYIDGFDAMMEADKKEEESKSLLKVNSIHGDCDHGVTFNEQEAEKILEGWQPESDIAFIMGNPSSSKIRKLWPRLNGQCPKGCGYNGIAYASYKHYILGDW
jgi:hypothetical protein